MRLIPLKDFVFLSILQFFLSYSADVWKQHVWYTFGEPLPLPLRFASVQNMCVNVDYLTIECNIFCLFFVSVSEMSKDSRCIFELLYSS